MVVFITDLNVKKYTFFKKRLISYDYKWSPDKNYYVAPNQFFFFKCMFT